MSEAVTTDDSSRSRVTTAKGAPSAFEVAAAMDDP